MKAIILLANLWLTPIIGVAQLIDTGTAVHFNDCNSESVRETTRDTVTSVFGYEKVLVNCVDSLYRLFYSEVFLDGAFVKHGRSYGYLLRDTSNFYVALYEEGELTGFSLNRKNLNEGYEVKNHSLHGSYTAYENGRLTKSGTYINGIKQGVWTKYYQNGVRQSRGSYKGSEIKIELNRDNLNLYEIHNLHDTLDVYPFHMRQVLFDKYDINPVPLAFPIKVEEKIGIWEYYDLDGNVVERIAY